MSESDQPATPAAEPTDTGQVQTGERENEARTAEAEAAGSDVSDVGTGDTSGFSGTSSGETLGSPTPETGPQRDPSEWVTGDQPATAPQKSYLDSLAKQAGEELSADLTKAEASEHIERIQEKLDNQKS